METENITENGVALERGSMPTVAQPSSNPYNDSDCDHSKRLSEGSQLQRNTQSPQTLKDLPSLEVRKKIATNLSNGCYWLSTSNPKTIKGVLDNWITAVLSLAPADYSDHLTCFRFKYCKDTCLFHQGRGKFSNVAKARIKKTNLFFSNPENAATEIHAEIRKMYKKLQRNATAPKLAVRLNCFSDIKWEEKVFASLGNKTIIDANPQVQFYDYTKIPFKYRLAWRDMPINYHLTYSYDGSPEDIPHAMKILENGHNVAIVHTKKNYKKFLEDNAASENSLIHPWGYKMVNNELSDNRFLDPSPVILVGKEKGHSDIAQ